MDSCDTTEMTLAACSSKVSHPRRLAFLPLPAVRLGLSSSPLGLLAAPCCAAGTLLLSLPCRLLLLLGLGFRRCHDHILHCTDAHI